MTFKGLSVEFVNLEDDIGNPAGKRECAMSIHISNNVQHSRKCARDETMLMSF